MKDPWVVSVVRHGLTWEFDPAPPPLSAVHIRFSVAAGKEHYVALEIEAMLAKSAIEVVDEPASPGYYSSIFLVPKKSGEL